VFETDIIKTFFYF